MKINISDVMTLGAGNQASDGNMIYTTTPPKSSIAPELHHQFIYRPTSFCHLPSQNSPSFTRRRSRSKHRQAALSFLCLLKVRKGRKENWVLDRELAPNSVMPDKIPPNLSQQKRKTTNDHKHGENCLLTNITLLINIIKQTKHINHGNMG